MGNSTAPAPRPILMGTGKHGVCPKSLRDLSIARATDVTATEHWEITALKVSFVHTSVRTCARAQRRDADRNSERGGD